MRGGGSGRRGTILAIVVADHPGICAVYEAGTADGVPFIAMRYIDGQTLARQIALTRRCSSRRTPQARRATATRHEQRA